ncbi:MAG TPA: tRNA 2-selenouridine(34) synthase MnmH [Bacteroidales bacterium]|nr:tRNA 2-selenouridine(34) synthase MnmH [Bacteroidales bacterium]HRZ22046.1 tRNA 2-selenouridine(34) synthase MnmH [Bacteroidales bacterium]
MIKYIDIREFSRLWNIYPVVDVRSPQEYQKGHIPGAHHLPLLEDEERALVGTKYVKSGRFASVQLGLELVGPKLSGWLRTASDLSGGGPILLHCWRGGLRSSSMAWLLDLAGMDVYTLQGGYKAYRHYIRQEFSTPFRLIVLAGRTGSGKTEILQAIGRMGHQVIDLEQIAHHRGSVFGGLGMQSQPTNEQYENDLYQQWQALDPAKPVWIEDESLSVGKVSIPQPLFDQMMTSQLIEVEMDIGLRVARLVREYSSYPAEELVSCLMRIEKRLGTDTARKAANAIRIGEFEAASSMLLEYYDKAYDLSIQKRTGQVSGTHLHLSCDDPEKNAHTVLNSIYL